MELEFFEPKPKHNIKVIDNEEPQEQKPLEQNANYFAKSDSSFMVDKVEYTEPTEREIKMLEGTKTPLQQIQFEKTENPVVKDERKIFIDMVKVIALVNTGHSPLINPSGLYKKEKDQIIKEMGLVIEYSKDRIIREFNDICEKYIFTPSMDYSTLPVIAQ